MPKMTMRARLNREVTLDEPAEAVRNRVDNPKLRTLANWDARVRQTVRVVAKSAFRPPAGPGFMLERRSRRALRATSRDGSVVHRAALRGRPI